MQGIAEDGIYIYGYPGMMQGHVGFKSHCAVVGREVSVGANTSAQILTEPGRAFGKFTDSVHADQRHTNPDPTWSRFNV